MNKKEKNAVLCYVNSVWAYFTTQPLEIQWGDDWDDAPYEHNAGPPYGPRQNESWEIIKVAWDGPFVTPDACVINSPYSVESINRGAVAWLRPQPWCDKSIHPIHAGTTLRNFIDQMVTAGGMVYLPALEDER